MIQYINKKDIYGPFHKRTDVYLPHSAEVTSHIIIRTRFFRLHLLFFFLLLGSWSTTCITTSGWCSTTSGSWCRSNVAN